MAAISSPVPVAWYPTLAIAMVAVGLTFIAASFMRSRSLAKEITTAAVASVFLGFGSLFVLLASCMWCSRLTTADSLSISICTVYALSHKSLRI